MGNEGCAHGCTLGSLISSISNIIPMATRKSPAPPPQPPRVGAALAALREQRSLSLDEVSRQAGVSKSMLSQIERGQANPTVAVVWRLATAFGVPLGDLLGEAKPTEPLLATVPAHATPLLASPDGKCELRILGPIDLAGRFEWYQLSVQPGGALDSRAHEPGSREHLTVHSGTLEVHARTGETARYAVDVPHRIHNPGKSAAQALLVVIHAA
jgi:XRE family transcriptional regulator, regulator of sulfur utilization